MQLFKNESLRDTGPMGHELAFGVPLFGLRYARRSNQPPVLAHPGADEIDSAAFARAIEAEPPLAYPPLHLMGY